MAFSKGNQPHNKGKKMDSSVGIKIGNALRGRKLTLETRLKMSRSRMGRKFSDETRKKISLSKQGKLSDSLKMHLKNLAINNTGKSHSEEHKRKIGLAGIGRTYKHSEDSKRKMSQNRRGKFSGENHPRWIKDRTKLKKYEGSEERRSTLYKQWRKSVWLRDNFKCKIANPDCCGRLEAHHILQWKDYPELRYEINNGITLCHAHHPRKVAEVKRLTPYFQELVSVSSY